MIQEQTIGTQGDFIINMTGLWMDNVVYCNKQQVELLELENIDSTPLALTSKRLCNTHVEEIILIIILIVRKYVSVVLLHALNSVL